MSSVIAKNLPSASFFSPTGWRSQFKSLFKLAITKTKNTARTYLPCFVWLGWRDLNSRMTESESVALPLGDTPIDFYPYMIANFDVKCNFFYAVKRKIFK